MTQPSTVPASRIHFSGVAGAGMNPLARLLAAHGYTVSGSDRSIDAGSNRAIAELLTQAGVQLLPQDGSAIDAQLGRLVHSTAVEADTPEMVRAREFGVVCQPRPALLAEVIAAARPGVAVAGSSGKSTVVGMVAWILRQAGLPATVLGGAALAEAGAQHMGCVSIGPINGPLVAEACESDGTLIGYHPTLGLIHNITRDHQEVDSLRLQFQQFAAHSQRLLVNADDAEARALGAAHSNPVFYGCTADASWRLDIIQVGPWRSQAEVLCPDRRVVQLDLPQPGAHTLGNGLAALVLAAEMGIDPEISATALRNFPGVARRFQIVGRSDSGITVVDDYAHNGAKIAAAVAAAQAGCDRLVAVFQPHGFGPARFLRNELLELLPQILRPQDCFCYAGIYYAGGTVQRDISSADLALDLTIRRPCAHAETHEEVLVWICDQAMPGDTVLLMGARDPRLGEFAQTVLDML